MPATKEPTNRSLVTGPARTSAAIGIAIAASIASASVPIYGGPTYESATGSGFLVQQSEIAGGGPASNGTAVGSAYKYIGSTSLGGRVVRWGASAALTTELGNLGTDNGGYTSSLAYGVNAAGTAVGYAIKYSSGTSLGQRAVRWDAAGTAATELGGISTASNGVASSCAYAVNAAGTAVGSAYMYSGVSNLGERAVRWDASSTVATELDSLGTNDTGTTDSRATFVNAAGMAVGFANKYSGATYLGVRAVRWNATDTLATELDNLGTDGGGFTLSNAFAVNASGTAIGYAIKYSSGTNIGQRAVRWDASGTTATELANLGTNAAGITTVQAKAVNDAGTAVGDASKYSDGGTWLGSRAVRWDASGATATELGNLGTDAIGRTTSRVYAINAAGTAVGFADKFSGTTYLGTSGAVAWRLDGVALDLNTLLSPADAALWTLTKALCISDTGWIIGYGNFDPDGAGPMAAYNRLFLMRLPDTACPADLDDGSGAGVQDGAVTIDDLLYFLAAFESGNLSADLDNGSGTGIHDNAVTIDDLLFFLAHFEAGC